MAEIGLPWAVRPATRREAGGGHVARCGALAVALKKYAPVVAVIEPGGENWRRYFDRIGIASLLEADVGSRFFAGIVIDDYKLSASDVSRWRIHTAGPIIQIEDFGLPLAGVDLAVNATPGRASDTIAGVAALVGPNYAMLAAPYADRRRPEIRSRIERIVVGIGWIDESGATERVVTALTRSIAADCRVDILLGSRSPNANRVAAQLAMRTDWHLHLDALDPWRLLDQCDLAISGAGQSLLERLAFGIPTLAIAVADNQRAVVAGAAAAGAAIDLGDFSNLSEKSIIAAVAAIAHDKKKREAMSVAAQGLIDGRGALRVAQHIVKLLVESGRQVTA